MPLVQHPLLPLSVFVIKLLKAITVSIPFLQPLVGEDEGGQPLSLGNPSWRDKRKDYSWNINAVSYSSHLIVET